MLRKMNNYQSCSDAVKEFFNSKKPTRALITELIEKVEIEYDIDDIEKETLRLTGKYNLVLIVM